MRKDEVIEIAVSVGLASFLRENDPVLMKKLEPFAAEIERRTLERAVVVCETGVDMAHPTVENVIMKNFGKSKILASAVRALKEEV